MCLSAGMIEPADECMHSQSAFVNLGISTLESAKKDICILGCDDEHDGKSYNTRARGVISLTRFVTTAPPRVPSCEFE